MIVLAVMHSRLLDQQGKAKSNFKIILVFFCTSPQELGDPANWSRWLSSWHELPCKNPDRVQVKEWQAALKYLRSIKGPVYDRLDELHFQNEIVDEICSLVPPEVKLEDSHIQGRSRLCKVILEKIDMLQKNTNNGVCVLGLYGTGGVGKTTICKALCNEFSARFGGRVCHVELEKGNEKEMLRELLKRLTNRNHVSIDGFNVDEMCHVLKEGACINESVFLALDNMSDSDESIQQVKSYLSIRLPGGSIVMVTARSKDWLTRVRPHIDESKCLQMPELEEEEAKSLFAKSSDFELRNDINDELILRCVQQCHFWKNDGSGGRHYHPLALDVLGKQLARLTDPKEWASELDSIKADIFNHSEEINHPVFSILRTSFDTLSASDQLLFMDVALFLPRGLERAGWNVFDWLGIVHGMQNVQDVMRALERLKAKSLLERVGDGFETGIGMHDLWRAFCKAETKAGKLRRRRWLYEAEDNSDLELVESSPCGGCWENVKRMAFRDPQSRGLERANFAQVSNVTVLWIRRDSRMTKVVVDLSELIHLTSLDVDGGGLTGSERPIVQGLPQSLVFLRLWWGYGNVFQSRQLIEEIACLKELQYLELYGYGGSKLPDMRSMVSLRVAMFKWCVNVVTVAGFRSELTRLRILDLQWCKQLRSCPGVGDLVALEELNCRGCERLEKLSNLQKLRNLRKLNISGCDLITEVPGLGDLVALGEFNARCRFLVPKLLKLPDVRKLTKLRVLDLGFCIMEGAVRGLENLITVQKMVADFREVVEKPNLEQVTNLQKLEIGGLSSTGLRGLENLVMLQSLKIGSCSGVVELPEFRSLTRLQALEIRDCDFKDLSGLSNLSTLETLVFVNLPITEESIPDLGILLRLKTLSVARCARLRRLTIREPRNALSVLWVSGCASLASLPDLCTFPELYNLELRECNGITMLSSSVPMETLRFISLRSCSGLKAVPDLAMFPKMWNLMVVDCCGLAPLSTSVPLPELLLVTTDGGRSLSRENLDRLRADSGSQFVVYND